MRLNEDPCRDLLVVKETVSSLSVGMSGESAIDRINLMVFAHFLNELSSSRIELPIAELSRLNFDSLVAMR